MPTCPICKAYLLAYGFMTDHTYYYPKCTVFRAPTVDPMIAKLKTALKDLVTEIEGSQLWIEHTNAYERAWTIVNDLKT